MVLLRQRVEGYLPQRSLPVHRRLVRPCVAPLAVGSVAAVTFVLGYTVVGDPTNRVTNLTGKQCGERRCSGALRAASLPTCTADQLTTQRAKPRTDTLLTRACIL